MYLLYVICKKKKKKNGKWMWVENFLAADGFFYGSKIWKSIFQFANIYFAVYDNDNDDGNNVVSCI